MAWHTNKTYLADKIKRKYVYIKLYTQILFCDIIYRVGTHTDDVLFISNYKEGDLER